MNQKRKQRTERRARCAPTTGDMGCGASKATDVLLPQQPQQDVQKPKDQNKQTGAVVEAAGHTRPVFSMFSVTVEKTMASGAPPLQAKSIDLEKISTASSGLLVDCEVEGEAPVECLLGAQLLCEAEKQPGLQAAALMLSAFGAELAALPGAWASQAASLRGLLAQVRMQHAGGSPPQRSPPT